MQVQEPWGDKSNATCCFYCNTDFTKDKDKDKEKHRGKEKQRVKDKHRCKCCGYIFCAACTPKACRKYVLACRDRPSVSLLTWVDSQETSRHHGRYRPSLLQLLHDLVDSSCER
jgi:hypothetical protein